MIRKRRDLFKQMDKIDRPRILWLGTPKMSADVLEALIKRSHHIIGIIAQPDKRCGRGEKLQKVPTKIIGERYAIPVFQPVRIRNDFAFIKDLRPDLILTLAYGQIVPEEVLKIPTLGALNFHASLLPSYRGAAPIERALMNDETMTGITLMEMVARMDAGKMYAVEKVVISPDDDQATLKEKLTKACLKIIDRDLPLYLQGRLTGIKQDESRVTFAPKLSAADERLDPKMDVRTFLAHVRALSPSPGGQLACNETILKIIKARRVSKDISAPIGTLTLRKGAFLSLPDGIVELLLLKPAGKAVMDGVSFANGHASLSGVLLRKPD